MPSTSTPSLTAAWPVGFRLPAVGIISSGMMKNGLCLFHNICVFTDYSVQSTLRVLTVLTVLSFAYTNNMNSVTSVKSMKELLTREEFNLPKVGQILSGEVIGISRSSVLIDLGLAGIGIVYPGEFY